MPESIFASSLFSGGSPSPSSLLAGAQPSYSGQPPSITTTATARGEASGYFDNSGFSVNFAPKGSAAWMPVALVVAATVGLGAVLWAVRK